MQEKMQEASDLIVRAAERIEQQNKEIERLKAANLKLKQTIDSYARVLADTSDISDVDKRRCGLSVRKTVVKCKDCLYAHSNKFMEEQHQVVCRYWTTKSDGIQIWMGYDDFCSRGCRD